MNDFETKVLAGVDTLTEKIDVQAESVERVESQQETLLKNYDQLTKETKSLMEDLTKIKKVANDQQANANQFTRTIRELQDQLRNEGRLAFGDPVRRISRDQDMRTRLNAAVRRACSRGTGGGDLERVFNPMIKALGEDASPGSTLIDDRLAREIYDVLSTFGVWNTFGVVRLGTRDTKFPIKSTRGAAQFVLTEGGTIAQSDMTGTSVTLTVEVIANLNLVSIQLLEDSEFDVTQLVLNDFAEAYAERLDVACLTATGAADATNGGMTGVLSGGTAAVAATGNVTTETTDIEDWTKVLLTVSSVVLNRMAKWWIHPQHLVRALSVKDLNGRPIFLTALEAPSPGAIGSILGYPVIPAFVMPTTNAANSKVAAFGDPQAQVMGIRRDFNFGMSDDFKFDTLQRAFRGWGRAGTKIRAATGLAYLQLAAA